MVIILLYGSWWLVVDLPLWKIWVSHLGLYSSQYMGKTCFQPPTSYKSKRTLQTLLEAGVLIPKETPALGRSRASSNRPKSALAQRDRGWSRTSGDTAVVFKANWQIELHQTPKSEAHTEVPQAALESQLTKSMGRNAETLAPFCSKRTPFAGTCVFDHTASTGFTANCPSGKLTSLLKITISNGKTHYKWPC